MLIVPHLSSKLPSYTATEHGCKPSHKGREREEGGSLRCGSVFPTAKEARASARTALPVTHLSQRGVCGNGQHVRGHWGTPFKRRPPHHILEKKKSPLPFGSEPPPQTSRLGESPLKGRLLTAGACGSGPRPTPPPSTHSRGLLTVAAGRRESRAMAET